MCAYLTSGGSSEDFGELRLRYGIDGEIVSPQHIFAYPDGRLIFRKEYWPYGTGQRAVDALLGLMDDALGKDRAKRAQSPADGKPAPGAEDDAPMHEEEKAPVAPESGEERAKWIQEQLDAVRLASDDERRAACKALVENDKEGDTLTPLLALLAEMKKHPDIQVDIVRAMGKPGLVLVVEGVCDLLGSKHADVRANAAVTLEYIGSPEALSDLRKRAPKEKEENIANHMYRAIGRCGAGDAKVRAFLVKKATGAKSNLASYGPIIGIAYFEKDEKAARDVEKLITRVSGGWQGGAKRALLVWCLAEVGVGNAKSAKFIREKVVPGIRDNQWTARFVPYYEAAADCCDGDTSARAEVERGASGALSFGRGGNPLMDEARRGRDTNLFTPKADWEGGGGGGGGPGGGPGGGGPGGGGGGAPRNP